MIKYTTFINTQIRSSNKNPQMHPIGISLYFTFDIFDTISLIHSDHFYSASSSPLLLRSNSNMHIWKEINRINQKEVSKPNKDCMTGVNQAMNYFMQLLYHHIIAAHPHLLATTAHSTSHHNNSLSRRLGKQ